MKLSTITLVIFLTTLLACQTNKVSINTVNIDNIESKHNYKTLYFLPRTVVKLRLELEKTSYIRGPYYKYAKSYLNLQNVIANDRAVWKISDVKFTSSSIPDTSKTYIVETANKQDVIALELTKSGYIKSIYPKSYCRSLNNKKPKILNSTKHSVKNEVQVFDNKGVSFTDIPLPKDVISKQSKQEQAVVLSKKILSLREDKSAILVGDGYTEAMPDGKALEIMITNIDILQKQYLSMFKGKIVKQKFEYTFSYIPNNSRRLTQAILCRFSEENGIVGKTDMSGTPVIIEIKSNTSLNKFKEFKEKQLFLKQTSKHKTRGFHYNIPEIANIRLIKDDKNLAEFQTLIAQLGTVNILPEEYLNGNYTIKFFPQLGSIKRIEKINNITNNK